MLAFAHAFSGAGPAAICGHADVAQLFLSMDANSDGHVGWDEFLTYMVQYNAQVMSRP